MSILGIGELGVSNTPDDIIKTFALGSCVAVILLHSRTKSIGMVHVALPDSSIDNTGRAVKLPGYFADTGIPLLVKKIRAIGCSGPGPNGGLMVKLAGGANVMGTNDTFQIGKRNILTAKKILWKYGLVPLAEDTGGNFSRTVSVSVNSGDVLLSSPAKGEWKI